jgi:precorrin-6B methylase 2
MSAPNSSPFAHRIALRGPASVALRVARLFPCIDIIAFDDDWSAIDRARDAADALGLSAHLSIHHTSAAPADLSPRRAA